jgi:hypothetical protein
MRCSPNFWRFFKAEHAAANDAAAWVLCRYDKRYESQDPDACLPDNW